MLSAGTHCGHACLAPHPLAQHMVGCRGAGWSPLPPGTLCPLWGRKGSQELLGVGPESGLTPPCGCGACGKLIRPEKRVICLALEKSDESQEGSEAPGPSPRRQPRPPRTCVGLRDAGARPRSRPHRPLRLGPQCLEYWILHLRLGLMGWQGKREKAVSGGVPTPCGRVGTWDTPHLKHPHLKHHDFAIICLQVEGPGGGDEALGRADDVVAEGGDQIEHGERRRLQLQALQRSKDIVSPPSPRHPARRTTSHPEDVTELSQTLRSGAQPASPRDGDMRDLWFGHRRVTEPRATVPRAITQPQGHHPAPRQP